MYICMCVYGGMRDEGELFVLRLYMLAGTTRLKQLIKVVVNG